MLTYAPGETLAHRLDPRSKLLFQFAFAAAAFAHTNPRGLAALTALAGVVLLASGLPPTTALWEFRFALPFLVAAPLVEALTLGPPWFVPADAASPALASYRVLLVLLVSAAYVRTTPVRDSRAAIQRTVPGKPGQFLGVGVALVFRFLPALQADLARVREAMAARLGDERPLRERMWLVAAAGLNRAFGRADRLALALRARCFAWNPTLPELRFSRLDVPAVALSAILAAAALV
ncbi:energy-coupling factor transporter transmembrane component T family protein [Halegenticoccus tardaugens]|uniref:energy-coupling factor transporter transmembrane component T family protein n=1 Tax=Halegenticoccus tardaugens TaxID=2071624 RepID=UPI00100C0F73|nr:energy-coupling factor transporter transmembrane protein EcfT [Halegenticoccus tardaugens]